MRSDNLVPLLQRQSPTGTGFRQGVIITWNPDTAENTVSVAGTVMTNLPILNTTEASLLATGDVVAIMTMGASFAILGRLVIPGSPEAVSSILAITNRIQAASDPSAGTRNSTTFGDLTGSGVGPSITARIGSSGRALVIWACELGQITDGGGVVQYQQRATPHVGIALSGANTQVAVDSDSLNLNLEHPGAGFLGEALSSIWMQNSTMHIFTGLNPGDTTFTMKYKHDNLVPSASRTATFQSREIAVFTL